MHLATIFSVASAHLFWMTKAQVAGAQVTVYKGSGCSGDSEVLYVDTATDYCFGVGGNSFNNFVLGDNAFDATLTTWSGSNCEGSSASFDADQTDCVNIPFAGAELSVSYYII